MNSVRATVVFTAVLLAGVTGCGSSSRNTSLVLNRSIGPVSLGETKTKIEAAVGRGRLVTARNHAEMRFYPAVSLRVIYISTPRSKGAEVAWAVETTSSRYRTKSGIGVGSTVEQVKKLGADCAGRDCRLHAPDPESAAVTDFSLDARAARVVRLGIGVEFN